MGDWYRDQHGDWKYDPDAPTAQNTATHILNAREAPVSNPYEQPPADGTHPDMAAQTPPPDDEDHRLPQSMGGLDGTQLAVCPTCGTGVAASRLRQL